MKNRKNEIMNYIIDTMEEKGYMPTYREIGEAVKLKSTSSVHGYMQALIEEGLLEVDNQQNKKGVVKAVRVVGMQFIKTENKQPVNRNVSKPKKMYDSNGKTSIFEPLKYTWVCRKCGGEVGHTDEAHNELLFNYCPFCGVQLKEKEEIYLAY